MGHVTHGTTCGFTITGGTRTPPISVATIVGRRLTPPHRYNSFEFLMTTISAPPTILKVSLVSR